MTTELSAEIEATIAACGPAANKHDKAFVAISVCIANGLDTPELIIPTLVKCGFSGGHIANILNPRKGPFQTSDHWIVEADGRLRLVDVAVS